MQLAGFNGQLLPQAELIEHPAERNLGGYNFKCRHHTFCLLQRWAALSARLPIAWNKLAIEMVDAPTNEHGLSFSSASLTVMLLQFTSYIV